MKKSGKIICANVNCKYNNANFECAYEGTIRLNYEHVNTVNDGDRSFLTCKSFEFCPQTKMVRIKDIEQPLVIDMDDPEDPTKGIHLYINKETENDN